jgi:hypothetical protein
MSRPKGSRNKKKIKSNIKEVTITIDETPKEEPVITKPVKYIREICKNPFKKITCENENIKVYIQINDENLPICEQCWIDLSISKYEWGEYKPDFNQRVIEELE